MLFEVWYCGDKKVLCNSSDPKVKPPDYFHVGTNNSNIKKTARKKTARRKHKTRGDGNKKR